LSNALSICSAGRPRLSSSVTFSGLATGSVAAWRSTDDVVTLREGGLKAKHLDVAEVEASEFPGGDTLGLYFVRHPPLAILGTPPHHNRPP
jgi:hypothetical protein